MSNERNHLYEFGEYTLNSRERNLWRNSEFVKMPPKVFDTLCLLVERQGEVLSKDEMLDTIWKDTFVEENNLSQNISSLRRIFGKENGFIETVPKKGFRFVQPVRSIQIEKHKLSQADENENFIVATQTKTHVVEETQISDENHPSTKIFNLRALFSFGIGLVLLFSLGFIGFNFFKSGTNRNNFRLVSNFKISSLTDSGNITSTAISPDGKFVAYLKPVKGSPTLHLKDTASGNDVELEIAGDIKPGFLQFSSDGKSILFRTKGVAVSSQKVYKISYFGGQPELVAEDVWGFFSISSDANRIAFYRALEGGKNRSLIVKNLDTGKEETVVGRSGSKGIFLHTYPAWMLNDTKLAYIPLNHTARKDIEVVDLKTRQVNLLEPT